MTPPRARSKRDLAGDRRGVAALEAALVAALVLVPLFLIAFDLGTWVWQQMQMRAALSAGGVYALSFPTQFDGICNAIDAAAPPNWTSATKTVTLKAPSCPVNAPRPTDTSCSASCAESGQGVYVSLTMENPFTPVYFVPLSNISASYVTRVQ